LDQREQAKKNIRDLREASIKLALNDLDELIIKMRKSIGEKFTPSSEAIQIKKDILGVVRKLAQNPSTKDLIDLVFNDPKLRIAVPNDFYTSRFYEPLGLSFTKAASGMYSTYDRTVYLPKTQHIFPYTYCGFVDIDRTEANTMACFEATLFDEFMHAAMHIINLQKNNRNSLDPFTNDHDKQSYIEAINADISYHSELVMILKKMKGHKKLTNQESKLWNNLVEAMQDFLQDKQPNSRFEANSQPKVLKQFTSKDVGETFLVSVDEERKFITLKERVLNNPYSPEGMLVFEHPPLEKFDYNTLYKLIDESIRDCQGALQINSIYKKRNVHEREVINRLPYPKWGSITELLLPNLNRFYQDKLLPTFKEVSVNLSQETLQSQPDETCSVDTELPLKSIGTHVISADNTVKDERLDTGIYLNPEALTSQTSSPASYFGNIINFFKGVANIEGHVRHFANNPAYCRAIEGSKKYARGVVNCNGFFPENSVVSPYGARFHQQNMLKQDAETISSGTISQIGTQTNVSLLVAPPF